MLGRLFKRKQGLKAPEAGPQIAMIALRSPKGLMPEDVCRAWAELFPGEPPLVSKGREEAVFEYDAGGRQLMLAAMGMPIPQPDLDTACQLSWMWPEAAAGLKGHTGHAVVIPTPSGDAIADALLGSRLICAVVRSGDAAGVYWGNGGQVHKPEMFVDMVTSTNDGSGMLPVPLWVGVAISADGPQGPFTLTTHGLSNFGHKEFEIHDARVGLGDLRELIYDMMNYVMTNGPVLKHNDTFGRDEHTRLRVEHTTSQFRKGEPVIRLHV